MYLVAQGWDVPIEDCAPIDPQPTSDGVQVTRRTFAGDGTIYDEGYYIELKWNILGSVDQYTDLLDQFNILSYTTAPVTVVVRAQNYAPTHYNGIAVQPEMSKDNKWEFFPRNVVILVKNLVQLVDA